MGTTEKSAEPFRTLGEVERLVRAFERRTLSRAGWNHRAHLAVAMWYLARDAPSVACETMICGIRRFNHAKGIRRSARGGYHETLTLFWLGVGRRLADRHSSEGALQLVNRFIHMPRDLPLRCYSEEVLWGLEARTRWVAPDREGLDAVVAALDA